MTSLSNATIYKYRLPTMHGVGTVWMPTGAVLLSVGQDFEGHACVWAVVEKPPAGQKVAPAVARRLATLHTGDTFPPEVPLAAVLMAAKGQRAVEGAFVGTAVSRSGLVVHVFDLGEVAS